MFSTMARMKASTRSTLEAGPNIGVVTHLEGRDVMLTNGYRSNRSGMSKL